MWVLGLLVGVLSLATGSPLSDSDNELSDSAQINDRHCGLARLGSARIVHGTETSIESYPWQISFQYQNVTEKGNEVSFHFCGGSIINSRWILTAAHCLNTIPFGNMTGLGVRVGSSDISKSYDKKTMVKVERWIKHPSFDSQTLENDLLLLRLARPLEFDDRTTGTVCLPHQGEDWETGSDLIATGWGRVGLDQEFSLKHLKEVHLTLLGEQDCAHRWANTKARYNPQEMTCAGGSPDLKGIYKGDSGGPLIKLYRGRAWLVGVSSFIESQLHLGYPSMFAKVSHYVDWIQSTIY